MSASRDLVRQARAGLGSLPREPRLRLAIVSCMDARVDPWRIVGADPGDIHVIRNAGGVVTEDVVRSLVVSTTQLGVDRISVIMHTTCGMEGLTRDAVEAAVGPLRFDPGGFASLEDELRRGVDALRKERAIDAPGGITGHIYDVDTGKLRLVVE